MKYKRVHIGEEIMKVMNDTKVSKFFLAEGLGKLPQTVRRMLSKEDLHPELLRNVSIILEHDFFRHYIAAGTEGHVEESTMAEMKEKLKEQESGMKELQVKNSALEKENGHLQTENALLKQVNELLEAKRLKDNG